MLKIGKVYEIIARDSIVINGVHPGPFFARLVGYSSQGHPVFEHPVGQFRAYPQDGEWSYQIIPLAVDESKEKKRGCMQKKKYLSEERANSTCNQLNIRAQYFNVYKCKFCDGWHIGHIPPEQKA